MVMVRLKGVFKVRAKGRTYYYAWRGGPRLKGTPGSPEFIASFQEATAPLAGRDKAKFAAWVTLCKGSPEFSELADSTKRLWGPCWTKSETTLARFRFAISTGPNCAPIFAGGGISGVPSRKRLTTLSRFLSRVLSYAVAEGALGGNLCQGIPNLYAGDRSDLIWEEADLEKLRLRWATPLAWLR
jgi:hypothetical protein